MAETPNRRSDEHSITVVPPDDENNHAAAGSAAAGELQQTESSAHDRVMWKKLKSLNDIVFWIELLEYSGNAIGTLAMLWATVVLLGGFCSLLSNMDFWFATVMVFLEGTRVFISKDTSVNQWLFGSTRAFRWDHFCFSSMHGLGNIYAVNIAVSISLAPIEIGSQIITDILKVVILAITSQLLTRAHRSLFAIAILALFALAGFGGTLYGSFHKSDEFQPAHSQKFTGKSFGLMVGIMVGIMVGTTVLVPVIGKIMTWIVALYGNPKRIFWLKVIMSSMLVCLPLLQAKSRYWNIPIAAMLLTVNWPEALITEQEQSNALLSGTWELLLKILDTIMPILFFWGVMFPLPGISLKVSFYMLLSVIAAVLIGNLQIPVAFLQILLSSLRLHGLLAGHHSHSDYHPLPDGASPNLVPSIVVFFVLEICQGSSNILGIILGLISFRCRRSLVRVLGLQEEEWGAKAVNLYYHQACMTIKEKGLFPMEKSRPPSLASFAVESLGSTSSEMQIVRLHVLDYYLQQGDSRFIAQIAKDAPGIVTKITGTISHLITDEESDGNDEESGGNDEDTVQQTRWSLSLSLKFVRRLAVAGGKIGTRFRNELSGNPILLHSLQRILDLEDWPQLLWEPAMDVIKLLALHDEATAKEIGSIHAVIPKLMGLFLNTGGVVPSVRKAAGEVLAYLTITSSDNCRSILDLEAGPAGRRDLIKNLINMLQDDECISVAANLLHNLYANSGDILIDLDLDLNAKEDLKSALRMMMQIIIGDENDEQQLENSGNEEVTRLMDATLRIASQIGYVIPKEDFALVLAENLAPNANAAAEKLVGKLVDTLKSNREPNREFPRLRRVLIETVVSIVEACPEYIEIFRNAEAEEALNKLIGTSSTLEKYKIFIEGEGVVPEGTLMHEAVDKAKRLIMV